MIQFRVDCKLFSGSDLPTPSIERILELRSAILDQNELVLKVLISNGIRSCLGDDFIMKRKVSSIYVNFQYIFFDVGWELHENLEH